MATTPPGDTPPPAGSPAPGGGLDIGQAFSWSWKQFGSNAQVLLTIGAIIFGVQLVVQIPSWFINGGFSLTPRVTTTGDTIVEVFLVSIFGLLLPLAGWLFATLITLGLIRVTLELTRGNKITLSEAFQTTSWGSYIVATILYGLACLVGILLCCIGIVVPIVMFSFFGYFIVDQTAGPTNGLGQSWKLVSSRLGDVILLLLCVFALNVAGLFTCGLASIFTMPFATLLLAFGYRKLRGEEVVAAI